MAESHTQQNRYAGAGFHRQRSVRGGVKNVTERDVIGMPYTCWCGDEDGHDWPDKNRGAPHPRDERNDPMSTAPAVPAELSPAHIKEFSPTIKAILMEIVNDFGIRHRIINGGHIILYPPIQEDRPFKVSAKRADRTNKQILEVQFMQQYDLIRKKAEPVKTETPVYEMPAAVEAEPTETTSTDTAIELVGEDHSDAMRAAIAVLTEALGISDLETEALQALDENEALKKRVAALEGDVSRAKAVADSNAREVIRLKRDNEKINGLLDEAARQRDVAVVKFQAARDLFNE